MTPSLGSTAGRVSPSPPPYSGGKPAYCGSESVISYHGALEPTNQWHCGLIPSSPSRLPAGQATISNLSNRVGVTEPQIGQNERLPPAGVVYFAILSSPASQRKPPSGAVTNVANGAP